MSGEKESDDVVVPVVEETASVGKAEVPGETVRVRTRVREDEHAIDVPLMHKRVEVTRVPVNRTADEPVGNRQEGETLVISVWKETVTLIKKYQVVEELHIRSWYEQEDHKEVVRLRRTEAEVFND